MVPAQFTTRDLPQHEQLEAWRAWNGGLFHVEGASAPCPCTTVAWALPEFGVSTVKTPRVTMTRDRRLVRSNPVDHWVFTVGKRHTSGHFRGECLEIPPHVPFIVSLGHSFTSQRAPDERTHLILPRDNFRDLASVLDAAEGLPLNTPRGLLLADYIALLRESLPTLDTSDTAHLAPAVRSMVLACMMPTPDRLEEASKQVRLTQRGRIRQLIDMNLQTPALGANMLCREIGMSRTSLYRLFEREHGVAHFIRTRRLLNCYTLLADPLSTVPIKVIADRHCFEDASTFSRAFKQEFGCTPGEVRLASVAGMTVCVRHDAPADEPQTLNEYLRNLSQR